VDALDAQYYEEHHDNGRCCFVRFQREVIIAFSLPFLSHTFWILFNALLSYIISSQPRNSEHRPRVTDAPVEFEK
jgi:hypothetical protein